MGPVCAGPLQLSILGDVVIVTRYEKVLLGEESERCEQNVKKHLLAESAVNLVLSML